MRHYRILIVTTILALLCLSTAALCIFYVFPNQTISLQQKHMFELSKGTGFNQFCRKLEKQKVIHWCGPLKWYSKFDKDLRSIKAGHYQISPDLNHMQLLKLFSEGKVHQYSITFVEGDRLSQIIDKLSNAEQLNHNLQDLSDLSSKLAAQHSLIEGLLFPDTYYYAAKSDSFDIIQRAYDKMQLQLQELWQSRAPGLPYKNAYEALIMASIIEKETGQAHERELIAAVFINRLNKKMRLQTDPTVIYGLGEQFQGDITRAHLRQKTPYNTYRINGLPPTPIAMPGAEAIYAALNPVESEFLYFVSKKDGTHQFSKTLAEHNRAVRKYQLGKTDGL